jgi:PAS domain S-box-containing protein
MITRYNRNLTYAYVNRAVEEITKIPAAKFIGRNTMDIEIDQKTAPFLEEMHLEVFRTGRKLKFEFKMTVEGQLRIFQASMVPEMSKDGTVNTVLNVSRDITQIKNFENELNTEKQRIIENNSLIASNIKLLGVKMIEACDSLKNTEFIEALNSIAEWTGISGRLLKLEPSTIDVSTFITGYHTHRQNDAIARNINFRLEIPQTSVKIYTDQRILTKVLDIITNNAFEENNVASVDIGFGTTDNEEIVFFVKDSGKGVPEDMQDKIFEPFFTKGKEKHTGLGLSIARRCVEQQKGRIWCYSQDNEGAQFFFTLPVGVHQPNVRTTTTDTKKWVNKKIHVVEDNDANYMLIEAMLKMQGPPIMTRSIDGAQALDYISNNPDIDLVLMDIQLPDINGYEVTRQVRTFNTKVPIIAQTAYAMYADVVKALEAGCNDFIAKPIKMKKMLTLLEKYLG